MMRGQAYEAEQDGETPSLRHRTDHTEIVWSCATHAIMPAQAGIQSRQSDRDAPSW